DPDPAAVTQGMSILAPGSHGAYRIAMLKSSAVLDLYTELRTLAAALDAANIPYGLADGLAVSLYTTPRATEDIDVLVAAADVDRVVQAAAPLGFRKTGRPLRVANGRIEILRLVKIDGADLLPLGAHGEGHRGSAPLRRQRRRPRRPQAIAQLQTRSWRSRRASGRRPHSWLTPKGS